MDRLARRARSETSAASSKSVAPFFSPPPGSSPSAWSSSLATPPLASTSASAPSTAGPRRSLRSHRLVRLSTGPKRPSASAGPALRAAASSASTCAAASAAAALSAPSMRTTPSARSASAAAAGSAATAAAGRPARDSASSRGACATSSPSPLATSCTACSDGAACVRRRRSRRGRRRRPASATRTRLPATTSSAPSAEAPEDADAAERQAAEDLEELRRLVALVVAGRAGDRVRPERGEVCSGGGRCELRCRKIGRVGRRGERERRDRHGKIRRSPSQRAASFTPAALCGAARASVAPVCAPTKTSLHAERHPGRREASMKTVPTLTELMTYSPFLDAPRWKFVAMALYLPLGVALVVVRVVTTFVVTLFLFAAPASYASAAGTVALNVLWVVFGGVLRALRRRRHAGRGAGAAAERARDRLQPPVAGGQLAVPRAHADRVRHPRDLPRHVALAAGRQADDGRLRPDLRADAGVAQRGGGARGARRRKAAVERHVRDAASSRCSTSPRARSRTAAG